MMVLTGQTPQRTGSRAGERRNLNVAVFLGRDLLSGLEDNGSAEALQSILERFDVDVGRFITRSGDETINAQFKLADGLLQKNDSVYLTGERDVFDFYNGGVKIVFRFR
jgi:translocation and assembly module TamB